MPRRRNRRRKPRANSERGQGFLRGFRGNRPTPRETIILAITASALSLTYGGIYASMHGGSHLCLPSGFAHATAVVLYIVGAFLLIVAILEARSLQLKSGSGSRAAIAQASLIAFLGLAALLWCANNFVKLHCLVS